MKPLFSMAAVLAVFNLAAPATAQNDQQPERVILYFLDEPERLSDDFPTPAGCPIRQQPSGPTTAAGPLAPLLLFVANIFFQEGLELLTRREERRLESYTHGYGARRNLDGLEALAPTPDAPQSRCLAVERWKGDELQSRFIFGLRSVTQADFFVRPLYARIVASPVTDPAGVDTVNTTVMLGFTAIVTDRCPGGGDCGVRRAEIIGSPSFSFRNLTAGGDAVSCWSADNPGCATLGEDSALLPRPLGTPAPITLAATVTEVSTRLRRAKLRQAIWERQRANLLEALNAVVKGALE